MSITLDVQRQPNKGFYRGQLSHVGEHYDMSESGVPWRVMALGMETGRNKEEVTLKARRQEQEPVIVAPPEDRLPHMWGTAAALKVSFGREPGEDSEEEMLQLSNTDAPVHMMRAYALVNVRLCSAVKMDKKNPTKSTTKSAGTPTMTRNCLPHLQATIDILQPTLCILQGMGSYDELVRYLRDVEDVGVEHGLEPLRLLRVNLGQHRFLLAAFSHPGARNELRWASATDPYLHETVVPTITLARQLSLAAAPKLESERESDELQPAAPERTTAALERLRARRHTLADAAVATVSGVAVTAAAKLGQRRRRAAARSGEHEQD